MSWLGYLANNIISVAGSARVKFIPVPPDRPVLAGNRAFARSIIS
jgi:hypothetical protein